MTISIAFCPKCKYYRKRPKPELFNESELQNSGVLKSKLEWDQHDNERRLLELQRVESGQPFTYEPYHYAWCEAFTPYVDRLKNIIDSAASENNLEHIRELVKQNTTRGLELVRLARDGDTVALQELIEHGNVTLNPVSGEILYVYALCAYMNPTGQCPLFTENDSKGVISE